MPWWILYYRDALEAIMVALVYIKHLLGIFKVYFHKWHISIPVFSNLKLMTTVVTILLNYCKLWPGKMRTWNLNVTYLTCNISVYIPFTPCKPCCSEHWSAVLHFFMSTIGCKIAIRATSQWLTDKRSKHSIVDVAQGDMVLMSPFEVQMLCYL